MPLQPHNGGSTRIAPLPTRLPRVACSGRIHLPLHRLQRCHAQRHADAEVRARDLAVDEFNGAVVHMTNSFTTDNPIPVPHVAAGRAPGVEGIKNAARSS